MALPDLAGLVAAAPDAPTLLAAAAAIFAASLLRGYTGFGFALAAVPLLGLTLAPSRAVAIALALQFAGGLMDFRAARRVCHWPSIQMLTLGALVGTPAGAALLAVASPGAARAAIALIAAIGALLLLRGFAWTRLPGPAPTAAIGLVAGLFNGLAAMPGPPVVAYYLAAPLRPEARRASLLVFFLATSVIGLASLFSARLLDPGVAAPAAIGLPLAILGSHLGERAFARGGGRRHHAASVAALLGVAALGLARALGDLL